MANPPHANSAMHIASYGRSAFVAHPMTSETSNPAWKTMTHAAKPSINPLRCFMGVPFRHFSVCLNPIIDIFMS